MIPDLDLVSARTSRMPRSSQDLAQAAEAAALAVRASPSPAAPAPPRSDRTVAIGDLQRLCQGYRRTGVYPSVSAIAGEGTAMQRDYDYSSAVHFADLRAPEEVGREAGERAVKRLNPRKVKSQSVPVDLDRRVSSSLIGHLLGAINGRPSRAAPAS